MKPFSTKQYLSNQAKVTYSYNQYKKLFPESLKRVFRAIRICKTVKIKQGFDLLLFDALAHNGSFSYMHKKDAYVRHDIVKDKTALIAINQFNSYADSICELLPSYA
jgi:hypothetical protein